MTMQVLCVQVGCNNDLKSFAPYSVGKFHSNLLSKVRGNIFFLKTEITVIGLYAIFFSVLLFNRYELVTGSRGVAVDTVNIELTLRLFLVLCILKNISQRLILFGSVITRRRLFRVESVVDNLGKTDCNFPYLTYCHFISHLSGRRNCRSTSA